MFLYCIFINIFGTFTEVYKLNNFLSKVRLKTV